MALHPNFPDDPHAILDPGVRWFPADEALREKRAEQLLPMLRKEVKAWRDRSYAGAVETSKSLLCWWFAEQHLLPKLLFMRGFTQIRTPLDPDLHFRRTNSVAAARRADLEYKPRR